MIDYELLEDSDLDDFIMTLDKPYSNEMFGICDQLYAEWRGWTE